jgi:segregation and condensation protein A
MTDMQATELGYIEEINFELPANLYVPTPPLLIESGSFRGPLDLLWHLIREQDIDILDIPMALIAAQYLQYIQIMVAYRFEVAPDYLLMAVRLTQIKSEMLLPKTPLSDGEEELDPRAFLVKQLVDYADIQKSALFLDSLKRWYRDVWPIKIQVTGEVVKLPLPDLNMHDLCQSYQALTSKKKLHKAHEIERPMMSLSQKMSLIMNLLAKGEEKKFEDILSQDAEKIEVALSFQASLELLKSRQIEVTQAAWNETLWLTRLV